jgi:hypothetical protein
MTNATNATNATNGNDKTHSVTTHTGGCHCGAVRFEADLDLSAGGAMCNCTVCTKLATVGTIVAPSAFRLLSGEGSLSSYEWGGRTAQRKFCKHCGVHCFGPGHLDVLGGDYISINLNALDEFDRGALSIRYWDGRHNNWQGGMRDTPWPVAAKA